jgi:hypothetical protein
MRTVLDGCVDTLLCSRPPVGRPISPARAEEMAFEVPSASSGLGGIGPSGRETPGLGGSGGGGGSGEGGGEEDLRVRFARQPNIEEPRVVGVRV